MTTNEPSELPITEALRALERKEAMRYAIELEGKDQRVYWQCKGMERAITLIEPIETESVARAKDEATASERARIVKVLDEFERIYDNDKNLWDDCVRLQIIDKIKERINNP